jgi:hypothetical protein
MSSEHDKTEPAANFDFTKSHFANTPESELLYLSENIVDIAGFRTSDMPTNTVKTRGWIAAGRIWTMNATKSVTRPEKTIPDVTFTLRGTRLGGSIEETYSTRDDISPEAAEKILAIVNRFDTESALRSKPNRESWALDQDDRNYGVKEVEKRWHRTLEKDFGITPPDDHRKRFGQSILRRIFKR